MAVRASCTRPNPFGRPAHPCANRDGGRLSGYPMAPCGFPGCLGWPRDRPTRRPPNQAHDGLRVLTQIIQEGPDKIRLTRYRQHARAAAMTTRAPDIKARHKVIPQKPHRAITKTAETGVIGNDRIRHIEPPSIMSRRSGNRGKESTNTCTPQCWRRNINTLSSPTNPAQNNRPSPAGIE